MALWWGALKATGLSGQGKKREAGDQSPLLWPRRGWTTVTRVLQLCHLLTPSSEVAQGQEVPQGWMAPSAGRSLQSPGAQQPVSFLNVHTFQAEAPRSPEPRCPESN